MSISELIGGSKSIELVHSDPTYSGGHFYPPADNTYDLGSATHSWRNIYVDSIYYGQTATAEIRIGDSDDYWKLLATSNIPTIYGVGAYMRFGDAFTTQNALNHEDDVLFTGETEHLANSFFGYNDNGIDVKFWGAGLDKFMLWDASGDELVFDNSDVHIGDGDNLRMGDYATGDFYMQWTGVYLQCAMSETGKRIEWGGNSTGYDQTWHGDSTKPNQIMRWDASVAELVLDQCDIHLGDGDTLRLGDAPDFTLQHSGSHVVAYMADTSHQVQWGGNASGFDIMWYGDSGQSNKYMHWDASVATLLLADNTYIKLGTDSDVSMRWDGAAFLIASASDIDIRLDSTTWILLDESEGDVIVTAGLVLAAATAPATGDSVWLVHDNTGDLTVNVRNGKAFHIAENGTDEYDFTDTALAMNGNNITGLGSIGMTGAITISPTTTGTFLDFVLETEWTTGTLIRADFASSTTASDDICGMILDYGNLTPLTTKSVTGYELKMPAFTQTSDSTTNMIGFYLSTAGALVQQTAAGTLNWFGMSIAMPNVTETTGTITSIGLAIAGGTCSATAQQFGIRLNDHLILALGTGFDQVLLNRASTLNTNTTLADVLVGTPVTHAIAANSLMISNITTNGDIAMYVSVGGHSQMVLWADGSSGDTAIMAASGSSVDIYIAGTKEYDFSATELAMNSNNITGLGSIAMTGTLTIDGANIRLGDNDRIEFGDAQDAYIYWTDAWLAIVAAADTLVAFGTGAAGIDARFYSSADGDRYMSWDASADALVFHNCDLHLEDGDYLQFGTDIDVQMYWADTWFGITAAANTLIAFGAAGSGLDVRFYSSADGNRYLSWDASADALLFHGCSLYLEDADFIYFGTDSDIAMVYDGGDNKLQIYTGTTGVLGIYIATTITNTLTVGASGAGYDVVFYGGTASNTLTWDASECVLNIASTMKAADNVVEVIVTDATTLNAGRGRGLHIGYTVSGTKTGTYGVRTANIETYVSEAVDSVCGLNVYQDTIADKAVSNLFGISIYMCDQGNAVGNMVALDVGINSDHQASGRHAGMRIRNHTGTARAAIMVEEGFTDTINRHSISGVDLNLITLDNDSGGIFYWDDSAVAFRFNKNLTVDDHIAAGGADLHARIIGRFEETYTIADNNEYFGVTGVTTGAKTSAAFTSHLIGVIGRAELGAANTQNWTHATSGMVGVEGSIETVSGSTGTVTSAICLYAVATIADAATITNLYGLYVDDHTVAGAKVTNAYGIYIEDINSGATLNYAIYSAGGTIFTAGPVQVGTSASKITVADGTFGFQVYGTLTDGSSDGLAMYTEGFAAGTLDGDVYGAGIWLQLVASAAVGAHEIRGLDVGIYDAGAVAATSAIVYGICISTYIGSTMNPSMHAMMRFNTDQSGDTPDAWFMAANNECIALTPGAVETADKYGSIAVSVPAGIKYLRLYDTADG